MQFITKVTVTGADDSVHPYQLIELSEEFPFVEFGILLSRRDLVERAKKLRSEIAQIFADAEHWNNTHTRFERIDPDPDGELAKLAARIDAMLESEDGNGPGLPRDRRN